MAFDFSSITRGVRVYPERITLYGPHGVGKSTTAAQFPSPVFIQTEDGMGMLETPAFPLATKVQDVFEAIGALYAEKHEFKTVVLDSVDWLESLIQKEIKEQYDPKDLGYGKDAVLCAEQWRVVLDGLNALRLDRGMMIVLLGHCEIKRFDSPDSESYDRYQPKLQARSSSIVQEWCDAVLFCNFKALVKDEEVNKGRKESVKKAVGSRRLIHTGEKPAYLAKNRYSMPDTMPMDWPSLVQWLPSCNTQTTGI